MDKYILNLKKRYEELVLKNKELKLKLETLKNTITQS